MKWEKLGQVFCPSQNHNWMLTHAANTVAECISGNTFRIYFSTRDENNRSSIASVITELNDTMKVIEIESSPVLTYGSPGLFDDSGVSLSCITQVNGQKFMYYLGWNLGVTVPWRNSIGLAIFDDVEKKYKKFSPAPLLDRNHVDPYSISYPFVMKDKNIYRMWYGSNLNWGAQQNQMAHIIKYAESTDGINWKRDNIISLNFKNVEEYAISRPFVMKENDIYKMWYSYRGPAYRIGYAESVDAINWDRKDEKVGITVSDSGWDSESVEYPFIFKHQNVTYMLYNGNKYGATGFGLARLLT